MHLHPSHRSFGLRSVAANIRFLAVLALLVWASCADEQVDKKPPLDQETMVPILVEVQLLESRAALTHMPPDSITPIVLEKYQELYTKFKVTEADFKTTLKYYEDHPKVMDAVFEKVIDALTSKEAALKATEQKDKPKPADAGGGPKK